MVKLQFFKSTIKEGSVQSEYSASKVRVHQQLIKKLLAKIVNEASGRKPANDNCTFTERRKYC